MSILVNVVKELHGSALVPHLEDQLSPGIPFISVVKSEEILLHRRLTFFLVL